MLFNVRERLWLSRGYGNFVCVTYNNMAQHFQRVFENSNAFLVHNDVNGDLEMFLVSLSQT